ncbi:MAG: class I SAM-dependent methyltransferase [Omnitrophica WOR_2 bacterium]
MLWQQLRNRLLFNLWYYRKPPWDTNISPPELMEFIHTHSPGRALDCGCGTGTNVITLAKNGWQVTGIDFAWKAIHTARWKARQAGLAIDLHVDDVTRMAGVKGPFDLILDIGCYHSLPSASRPLYREKIAQELDRGGTYLLYAFFRPADSDRRGITDADLEAFTDKLILSERKDGFDRGQRQSTWLKYTR